MSNKIYVGLLVAAFLMALAVLAVSVATLRQTDAIRDRNLILVDEIRVLNEQNALLRQGCAK